MHMLYMTCYMFTALDVDCPFMYKCVYIDTCSQSWWGITEYSRRVTYLHVIMSLIFGPIAYLICETEPSEL